FHVTGGQTCALPISVRPLHHRLAPAGRGCGLRGTPGRAARTAAAAPDRQGRPAAGVAAGLGHGGARARPPPRLPPLRPASLQPSTEERRVRKEGTAT